MPLPADSAARRGGRLPPEAPVAVVRPAASAPGRSIVEAETVSIFGCTGEVELLTRQAQGPWAVETILIDGDEGR